jgi:phage terminase large subunit
LSSDLAPVTEIEIFPAYVDYLQPARFKVAYGGRGSAKTRTFTSVLTNNVLEFGWRVVCFREIMNTISESVYQEFVEEIERRNLQQYFNILNTHIECPLSGGVIKFSGLRANTKRLDSQKLKGFSNFDAAWLEEANAVSHESWQALIPTMRKEASEIFVSFNPMSPLEETYKLFVTNRYFPDFDDDGNRYCIVKKINYSDNPRFPKELRDHMEMMREADYEAYLHVYEGEPVGNDELAVIKSAWVSASVDAHLKLGLEATGPVQGGFDVADDGPDRNALVWKKGFVTLGAEEWNDKDPNSAASHAHSRCLELAIETLRYDDIGVGAGAKGQFRQMQEQTAEAVGKKYHRVHTDGWTASAAVDNPDREYMPGKKNKDMFLNKKAQAWWTLADKFRNTFNAVNGKPYDPEKLVSISSGIQHLEKLKAELSQPNRDYVNGKVKVESKADMKKRGVASPNLADAFVMAHDDGGGFDINSLL